MVRRKDLAVAARDACPAEAMTAAAAVLLAPASKIRTLPGCASPET
jgi:hypothetical protein